MKIRIIVRPNAKKPQIRKEGDTYYVWVDAPPVKDKANRRLIEILSKHFKISKSKIRIITGKRTRQKIVEITK